MSSEFTVVMRVRHQFGDESNDRDQINVDSGAPFVGLAGEFPFSCPGVDSSVEAVLQLAHRGSMQLLSFPTPQPDGGLVGITQEHPVIINGQLLFGGIPAAPFRNQMPLWNTRLLIIQPGVLREDNILRIEASPQSTDGRGFDDFTVDNVVVFFKSRIARRGPATPSVMQ